MTIVVLSQTAAKNSSHPVRNASRSACGAAWTQGRTVAYDSSAPVQVISASSQVSFVTRSKPRSSSAVTIVALSQTVTKKSRQPFFSASRSACGAATTSGRISSYPIARTRTAASRNQPSRCSRVSGSTRTTCTISSKLSASASRARYAGTSATTVLSVADMAVINAITSSSGTFHRVSISPSVTRSLGGEACVGSRCTPAAQRATDRLPTAVGAAWASRRATWRASTSAASSTAATASGVPDAPACWTTCVTSCAMSSCPSPDDGS